MTEWLCEEQKKLLVFTDNLLPEFLCVMLLMVYAFFFNKVSLKLGVNNIN